MSPRWKESVRASGSDNFLKCLISVCAKFDPQREELGPFLES